MRAAMSEPAGKRFPADFRVCQQHSTSTRPLGGPLPCGHQGSGQSADDAPAVRRIHFNNTKPPTVHSEVIELKPWKSPVNTPEGALSPLMKETAVPEAAAELNRFLRYCELLSKELSPLGVKSKICDTFPWGGGGVSHCFPLILFNLQS
jgi:hypothetical protein